MLKAFLRLRPSALNFQQRASFALWDKPDPADEICETALLPGGKIVPGCGILDASGKCLAPLIPVREICRFVCSCLIKVGVDEGYAKQVSNAIAMAEFKGIYWHGLSKLPIIIEDIKCGAINPGCEPQVVKEGCSTAVVCGANGLGHVICNFAMKLAIAKAKGSGISLVTVNQSNYCGMLSFYTDQALQCGLIGLAFSNSSPCAAPPCADKTALGCNPLSFAAPGKDCDALVMDMSTTVVSLAKVCTYAKSKASIPESWGSTIAKDPAPLSSPEKVISEGAIPLLGSPKFGYKGYSLSFMVEALTGVLSDALYGPYIRKHATRDEEANLGQSFLCINPEFFSPDFQSRLSCLMGYIRKMKSLDPDKCPVEVPGDRERAKMKSHDENGGVLVPLANLDQLDHLALSLGVPKIGRPACCGGDKSEDTDKGKSGDAKAGAKIEASGVNIKASGPNVAVSGPKVDVKVPEVKVKAPEVKVKAPEVKVDVKVSEKK